MRKNERDEHGAFQPRLLSLKNAAFYTGMSPTKFLELVAQKRLPAPKRIDGMVRWDRIELDPAIDDMGDEPSRVNTMDALVYGDGHEN